MARVLVNEIKDERKNYIINGNFDFWQRGTTFAAIGGGEYSTDRFEYLKSGAMVHTISRDTDVPNSESTYSLRANLTTPDDSIAATDYCIIQQLIEGYNIQDLVNKKVTVSFYVKATTPGVYCVGFTNVGADRAIVKEYTIDAADTWEKKTLTFDDIPTDGTWDYTNGIGLYVRFPLVAGTNYHTTTTDVWENSAKFSTASQVNGTTTGSTDFKLSQVMLNEGETAAPFSRAGGDIEGELAKCQRYYQRGGRGMNGQVTSTAGTPDQIFVTHNFVTEMRSFPTVTVIPGLTGTIQIRRLGSNHIDYDATTISLGSVVASAKGIAFRWLANHQAGSRAFQDMIDLQNDSLDISAEL